MTKKDIQGRGVKVFNAVRNTLDPATKQSVPKATANNLPKIRAVFADFPEVRNKFLTRLYDKVAVTIIQHNMFSNPLSRFKQSTDALGTTIEEIHANLLEAEEYDYSNPASELLRTRTPDVDATYHVRNREERYAVTLRETQMAGAFTSWNSFESLVSYILTRLTDSNERDEFNLMKMIPVTAYNNGHVHTVEFGQLSSDEDYNRLAVKFREISGDLTFYNTMNGSGRDTVTPKDKQIILIPNKIKAKFDVTVLAEKFNMSKAEFEAQHITVDSFGDDNIIAFVVSENFFIVYDSLTQQNSQYNPALLQMTHFFHVFQTLAYSPYANAVAIVKSDTGGNGGDNGGGDNGGGGTGGGDGKSTFDVKLLDESRNPVTSFTAAQGTTQTANVTALAILPDSSRRSFNSDNFSMVVNSAPAGVEVTFDKVEGGGTSFGTIKVKIPEDYVPAPGASVKVTWGCYFGTTMVGPDSSDAIEVNFEPDSVEETYFIFASDM